MAAKLKVYRTSIGFHDAYVAAASQKAALEAWGSDTNLFAQKTAEIVTDETLTAEPLAKPGTVIKRLRGTLAEQLAALPPDQPKRKAKAEPEPEQSSRSRTPAKPKPTPKPKPRPDRSPLAQAEQALADAEQRQADEQQAIREREAELARERRALEKTHAREIEALEDQRKKVQAAYDKAMEAWRG